MRRLILRNFQSAGDIVMLTAAVRDLHLSYPGGFITDVRTPFPGLWAGNPYITPLRDDDPDVHVIDCHYPLIHRSNTTPCHFLHAFPAFLNDTLGLRIRVTDRCRTSAKRRMRNRAGSNAQAAHFSAVQIEDRAVIDLAIDMDERRPR